MKIKSKKILKASGMTRNPPTDFCPTSKHAHNWAFSLLNCKPLQDLTCFHIGPWPVTIFASDIDHNH